jgi:hypothetical protein
LVENLFHQIQDTFFVKEGIWDSKVKAKPKNSSKCIWKVTLFSGGMNNVLNVRLNEEIFS